jgi:dTDP-4-amino-4,6-dideoxygalactose transaminase
MERGLHADLPVTDAAAARTLALPMFPGLSEAEHDQVIAAVRAAVGRHLGPDASGAAAPAGIAAR